MKNLKKFAFFALLVIMMIALMACVDKNDPQPSDGKDTKTQLTPSSITILADLTDYTSKESYYNVSSVSYSYTTQEIEKLTTRINEKKTDPDYDDFASVVKIFANSDASEIIEKMGAAALPSAKMTALVDYLAGTSTVTGETIEQRVATGKWEATNGWSFFDDWDYYEKLQDESDNTAGKTETRQNTDSDNVKRQYRNIAAKIYKIGMTGDEFGRLVVEELGYAMNDVVSEMAGGAEFNTTTNANDGLNDAYWIYCKKELKDYDLLVYFLAFDDLLNSNNGKAKSVQLYGYYYDYEKKNYDETSDAEFETQLKYSHYETFTNAEWLEYVELQRNSYEDSYRYSDNFYEKYLYASHLNFQGLKEKRENLVYIIELHNSTEYTEQMRSGMNNGGFAGQLKMTDWMWCYGGDEDKMKEYNAASTLYNENKDAENAEKKAEGEFKYNEQQLKFTDYLLTNMSKTELSCMLRYQVYNYSSDMISRIQNNKKESVLISADINEINTDEDNDYAYILNKKYASDVDEAKEYAIGKLSAFNNQITIALSDASVDSKIKNVSSEPWDKMREEVEASLDESQYSGLSSYKEKQEKQEDLVIKKVWKFKGQTISDEEAGNYPEATKEYDTSHAISQFADKYAGILQHAAGQSVLKFRKLNNANYNLKSAVSDEYYYPKYYERTEANADRILTPYSDGNGMLILGTNYDEWEEKTINSGKGYVEALEEYDIDTKKWYNNTAKTQTKGPVEVEEKTSTTVKNKYTYYYEFAGWYIDENLYYLLEEDDIINTDLILYPGYYAKKIKKTN